MKLESLQALALQHRVLNARAQLAGIYNETEMASAVIYLIGRCCGRPKGSGVKI